MKFVFGFLMLLALSDMNSANTRICGDSLTQFLEMVCVDGFNSKNLITKKSDSSFTDNGAKKNFKPLTDSSLFLGNFNENHFSLMAKTRRRRFDGVADECCRKPCAMSELLSYCL